MRRELTKKVRATISAGETSLTDEDALDGIELFAPWAADTAYARDVRVRYGNKLYKCVQAHTSQEAWTPDATPALWTEVAKPGEIPVWRQPTGAQDAYRIGDLVHYPDADGPVYRCTLDYNTYAPDVYGWEVVA